MAKNSFQDIIKIKKIQKNVFPKQDFLASNHKNTNVPRNKYMLWLVAFVSLIFLFFALSILFFKANLFVNPKVKDMILNQDFSANKSGADDHLSFDLVAVSGTENKNVVGTVLKDVSEKAEGVVLVYNAFSILPQTLALETKLEGSNGKIYKTLKKITVPGIKKDGAPGSAEVNISASVAGEEYNSAPLDFKIVIFKGTPKYAKFYARSKGEIVGGYKGKFHQVSLIDKTIILNSLKATLKEKLLKKATDQIPPGFILFKDAVFLNLNDEGVEFSSKENSIPIQIKGTLYGFLFEEKKLINEIAKNSIDQYDGSEIYMQNIRSLIFSLSDDNSSSFEEVKNLNFHLSGPLKIVWRINENKFIADLLDKTKDDFKTILAEYPSIDSADLVIKPFWKSSFPSQSKDIEITVNYPK